jgi:5-methylcytosine-specific restriction endonuclease McrA
MTTRPTAEIRRQVVERAGNCCEYCLLHQDLAASTHQVDHVIAEKHGGQTSLDNLALSCMVCNRRKGSDIGSLDPTTGVLVPLFNPRTQQ